MGVDRIHTGKKRRQRSMKVSLRKSQVVRFALGTPAQPDSSVWRAWTWGDDVYLGVRDALHLVKVSLHKSGVWRIAFVRSLDRPDRGSDRLIMRWTQPNEFCRGVTRSIAILVPSLKPAEPLRRPPIVDPSITWWPPAPPGHRGIFTAFFSAPHMFRERILSVTPQRSSVVCEFPLPDGRTFWILTLHEPSDEAELAHARDAIEKINIKMKPGANVDNLYSRTLVFLDPPATPVGGPAMILDIPLGRGNVTVAK